MKKVKYPCRNCVYAAFCGDSSRTEPCEGRETKNQKKDKSEEESDE